MNLPDKIEPQIEDLRARILKDALVKYDSETGFNITIGLENIMSLFTHQLELDKKDSYKQGWDSAGGECIGDLQTLELAKIEAYKKGYIDGGIETLKNGSFDVGTIPAIKQKYEAKL